jgi:hypothetical protein
MVDSSVVLRFERERETRNTVRFHELAGEDAEPLVGSLYVRKEALAQLGDPDELTVTVHAEHAASTSSAAAA